MYLFVVLAVLLPYIQALPLATSLCPIYENIPAVNLTKTLGSWFQTNVYSNKSRSSNDLTVTCVTSVFQLLPNGTIGQSETFTIEGIDYPSKVQSSLDIDPKRNSHWEAYDATSIIDPEIRKVAELNIVYLDDAHMLTINCLEFDGTVTATMYSRTAALSDQRRKQSEEILKKYRFKEVYRVEIPNNACKQ